MKLLLDASALYPLAKMIADGPRLAERLVGQVAMLDLTLYEACNAALVEYRRGLIGDPLRVCRFTARLAELVEVVRVEPDWLEDIERLAMEKRLTFYDAAYVYVASLYGYRLVTEDREILRAYPEAIPASQLRLDEDGD